MNALLHVNDRRLRVLHIGKYYPPYRGGMETHIQDLCRAIFPYLETSVIVSNTERKTVQERDGEIVVERVGTWAQIASAPVSPGMVRAIRQTPAEIVHVHCPNPIGVLSFLASGHPGRLVITYQSDVVRQRILRLAYDPWFNRLASRAAAIVCLSPNYIESSPTLRRYREKCHVISHGIDPNQFQQVDQNAVAKIRSRFGTRIVLAVGRLVYYKGFEFLIRAIARANATLLIIGTGPLREHLQNVCRECEVSDRVHFLGEVEDVVPYYHAATVFTLPSVARSEAFGIVQLEAMACGTPVINTSLNSGVPFVSLDGISGFTVPPADVPALASAITRILDDASLRAHLSAGARRRVNQHFTVSAMAEKTIRLYEHVCSEQTAKKLSQAAELAPV
jgi:glycosyltransferase involved in cell wall biosynthesis